VTLAEEAALASAATAAGVEEVLALKGTRRVSVCVPARNEAATVADVVDVIVALEVQGVVDEVVVVDDASSDGTGTVAALAGARVVASPLGPGKGEAMRAAAAATNGEIVVFVDADVVNFSPSFVTALIRPLLCDPAVELVKASYRRPFEGRPDEGGRVTELLAKPLLRRFFPELADLPQPLSGECAIRRSMLERVRLADGYGIEVGLLIDVYRLAGRAAIVDVDLGERVHRNHPLHDLRPHADQVLAAVLDRLEPLGA